MDHNWQKTTERVKFEESRKIPWELNSVLNRESENIALEGVKKENKPFRVKNQFFYLDGNWKCQKETKFFKWSRPKKLNSVRLLPRKYTVYFTPLNLPILPNRRNFYPFVTPEISVENVPKSVFHTFLFCRNQPKMLPTFCHVFLNCF